MNLDLVVRGNDGEISTVRYEAVNAMLLNEFLQAHRKIEEQETAITELKSILAKLEANLKLPAGLGSCPTRWEYFSSRSASHLT